MDRKWSLRLCAFAGAVYLGACAHQPAARPLAAEAPPPAPEPTAATRELPRAMEGRASAKPPQREARDLAALLQGTVIHFDFEASLLTPESMARLQKLADA